VTGSKRIRPRCEFGHWPHTDVSSVASADLGVHHAAMARTSAEPGLHRRDPRRLVVLVGQRKALAIAVKGARARRRWSKLREWLAGYDRISGGLDT